MGYVEQAKELEEKWEALANLQYAMDIDYSIACEGECTKKLPKDYWEQYYKVGDDMDQVEEELLNIWTIDHQAVSKEWSDKFHEQVAMAL